MAVAQGWQADDKGTRPCQLKHFQIARDPDSGPHLMGPGDDARGRSYALQRAHTQMENCCCLSPHVISLVIREPLGPLHTFSVKYLEHHVQCVKLRAVGLGAPMGGR